jgi:hypothetical protein
MIPQLTQQQEEPLRASEEEDARDSAAAHLLDLLASLSRQFDAALAGKKVRSPSSPKVTVRRRDDIILLRSYSVVRVRTGRHLASEVVADSLACQRLTGGRPGRVSCQAGAARGPSGNRRKETRS